MHLPLTPLLCALVLPCLSLSGSETASAVLPITTRQQTIRPIALPLGTPVANPRDVPLYRELGYSAWQLAPGEDQGRKLDLMPAGYTGSPNAAQLLSFFSFSDVHITDKESPSQVPYFGWAANFGAATTGLYSQAYSPVMLSTPQVLDAAVRTVNALHAQSPFDFGVMLGDVANSSQFNELRWFIDVMDGQYIEPSSGDHRGADSIGYQKPFQAAGLDPSIPWYEVIGNHDQFWMGVMYPNAKLLAAPVSDTILNIGPNLFQAGNSDATGVYVGVVDGTTPYGDVVKGGPEANFTTPPTVVADEKRHLLTTPDSLTASYIGEFFNTTSAPAGHGFDRTATGNTAACYSFTPKSDLPLKVIVFDDTCKSSGPTNTLAYFGSGWVDPERYAWLTDELQKGQDAGQLMILAVHIPINPHKDLNDTTSVPQFYPASYKNDAELIATLQRYPNVVLLIAGHRHVNVVTPHPSTDPAHPENGFWEVECPSLRDFPRQFRTFDLRRNLDNTLSIVTTDVDPQVAAASPAADSLGYAIGAYRIFGNGSLTDETSHSYNAELVQPLSPAMQAKLATLGTPLPQDRPPALTIQPAPAATNAGASTSFEVLASSPLSLAYQWQRSTDGGATWTDLADGTSFSGTTTSRLTVRTPAMLMIGQQFRCTVADGIHPAVTSRAATLTVQWSQLAALSVRAAVGTGEQSLILGFAFASGGKPMLVRGVGPGLLKNDTSLAGLALADPQLQLFALQDGAFVPADSNDNWGGSDTLRDTFARLGAGPLDATSKDAALAATLPQTVYTAHVSGVGGTTGIALAEAYDAALADQDKRLTALSVRTQVGAGADSQIAGFVIAGEGTKKIVVRAVGPGLAPGVTGYLADPTLRLWKLNPTTGTWTLIAANDNWGGASTLKTAFSSVGMGALATDSKDAALMMELEPGIYTAQVNGVGATTGVALVEAYELP